MKPQSLQDAIKAQAMEKAAKRAREWKEPEVKTHRISAEEFKSAKAKPVQSPAAATPVYSASNSGVSLEAFNSMKNQIMQQLSEMKEIRNMLTEFREEMKNLGGGSKNNSSSGTTHDLQSDLTEFRKEMKELKEENRAMKVECSAIGEMKIELASVREDMKVLLAENKSLREELKDKMVMPTGTKVGPLSPSMKQSTKDIFSTTTTTTTTKPRSQSTPKPRSQSRKKARPGDYSIEPHAPYELYERQRKDKELKDYLKTREGLWDEKYLRVDQIDGHNIVCFHNKVYIPHKLRKKTLQYYRARNPVNPFVEMEKNCIWPDMESTLDESTSHGD
jgi:hypothetical protein